MLLKYLVEQDPSFKIRSINLGGRLTTNPSIVSHNNSLVFTARSPGYMLFQSYDPQVTWEGFRTRFLHFNDKDETAGGFSSSTLYLGSIDPDTLKVLSYSEIELPQGPNRENVFWRGIEDIKLVSWNDMLCGIGASRDFNFRGFTEQILLTFDDLNKSILINSLPVINRVEKNWMPVEDSPQIFMRWPNPGQVVTVNKAEEKLTIVAENKTTPIEEEWRGSGQLIKAGDHYLALVHISYRWQENNLWQSRYKHRFVLYNKNFTLSRASKQFTFFDAPTEFGNGILLDNGRLFISFGIQDTGAFICSANIDNVMEFIYD